MAGRTVKDYMDFTQNVINNIPNQVGRILRENEQEILDLNRKLQLFEKGQNRFGKVIGVYRHTYDPGYGSQPDGYPKIKGKPYNFYDTADLYSRFEYEYNPHRQTIKIYSTSSKVPELVMRVGDIFGLNQQNKVTFNNEIVKPELWQYIKTWL